MAAATDKLLTGDIFAKALISGIHRVIGQQEHLNKINVFPVADSDTGTNLSLSLSAALGVLRDEREKHLGTMLAAVADVLLDGARGNSGAILAQFFQGMSDAAGETTRFTTYTFGRAVSTGSEYAHDALSKPREGTILSVIDAFAISLSHQVSQLKEENFPAIFNVARKRVADALANTPSQLAVLRKAGVVDAGAKGFAELVNGIDDYLQSSVVTPVPDVAVLQNIEPAVDFSAADNASSFRFCTECLVTGVDIDRRKLREALAEIGDSLVLAGSKRKAKIHIHVDEPERVFDVARQFGELAAQKADDMHRQQHATHDAARTFAVITDSAADISDADMERFDIHMVPCRIQFGDRGYLDKVSITSDEFYDELRNNESHPTTSQPAPGDFRRQYQFLASHFAHVLSINLTSRASGTFQGALAAAERVNAAGEIHVVDSLNASIGQGQLAVLAAECADAGVSVEDTLQLIQEQIPRTRSFALLDDLRFAVRGGRLPHWVKTVADWLRLMVVIGTKTDGRIALSGFLLGRNRRLAKFARHIAARVKSDEPLVVGIGHAICEQDAQQLAVHIKENFPNIEKLTIDSLGTALGVHGGPGTLLVSTSPYVSADNIARGID
ncbi:MAG: DegV family EDD domain-containing protein [Gammaproteobacteria bacterium]|nr:DegV family EDD domain-containing protein [Gammaproteobacteria bacterium]